MQARVLELESSGCCLEVREKEGEQQQLERTVIVYVIVFVS